MITVAPKISKESAIKILQNMMLKAEIAQLPEQAAAPLLNLISFGKLYLENDSFIYELSRTVDVGGNPTKRFKLLSPTSSALSDNNVKLTDFNDFSEGQASDTTIDRFVAVVLGVPVELVGGLTIKDKLAVFQVGSLFFLSV